ncbi:MAG: helix-turn-helix transcriptional regulator [Lachnospiraceae bacterium]|nr:helix-turn-helix transcriptional regulator [Lachnospiraceae bacterium]
MKNKRMKIARVECELTQEQLADKVGITRQTIGLIEAGKYNPSISMCIDICKALNRTLDELFWPLE